MLSHLRILAVEKYNSCLETVNVAQSCGIKELIYEFKTSLGCRDPDGDLIYLHGIPTGKKNPSLEINLEINYHKQWKCLAGTQGKIQSGPRSLLILQWMHKEKTLFKRVD